MLALIAVGTALAHFATAGSFAVARENRTLRRDLAGLQQQLTEVRDTIATIAQRDEQLRLVAGLPSVDSANQIGLISSSANGADARIGPFSRVSLGAAADINGLMHRANTLSASFAEISDVIARNTRRLEATPSIMPTAGWLTSHFSKSRFHPLLHESRPHEGIDVSAAMGAPIVAPATGVVVRAERDASFGLLVEIDHGNGIVTRYAHCSRLDVRPGQRVTRGEVIAAVGNTGLSSGPHLHYEIRVNGRTVDPLKYVLPSGAIAD